MPVKHCCYGTCNSDSRYLLKREDLVGVFFIPFPKPKTQLSKCQRWSRLCGRQYFDETRVRKETYICSKHFIGGNGPTESHPDPIPASATSYELENSKKMKRKAPVKRCRPTNFNEEKVKVGRMRRSRSTIVAEHSYHKEDTKEEQNSDDMMVEEDHTDVGMEEATVMVMKDDEVQENVLIDQDWQEWHDCETVVTVPVEVKETREIGVQTDVLFDDIKDYSTSALKDPSLLRRNLFLSSVMKDNETSIFYTGLSLSMLALLFSWLGDKALNLNYWRGQDTSEIKSKQRTGPKRKLTVKEEFILTLVRLRRGLDIEVLSYLFGIHSSSISRIFTTWLNFLYLELNFLISWPTTEQVKANLPVQFKYFPKTKCIIDCTEFFVQKPSLPSYQRSTWSHYKHHNTFKVLISITPTGTFSFISKLYSGNISDKSIVEKSGFLDKIQYGDDVMADRGFLIRGLLASRYATLNIPPFSFGKQLSSKAVTKTRRIASVRIHVERAIGQLKNFKILQGIMPLKLHPLFDQMIIVCAALCNLDVQLVK